MPAQLKDSVTKQFYKELSGKEVDMLAASENTSRKNIGDEKRKIEADKKTIERWSDGGKIIKEKDLIARGVEEKLRSTDYSKVLEKQKQIDAERAGFIDIAKGKNLLEVNALKDRNIDFQTDMIATTAEAYSRAVDAGQMTHGEAETLLKEHAQSLERQRDFAVKNISSSTYLKTIQSLNETIFPSGKTEKATYYTAAEIKSTSDRYHLGKLNYELISPKDRNAIEAKLEKAGLKPPAEMLKTTPEMKAAYQDLVVNYALKERQILAKSQESAINQKKLDSIKNSAVKEVTTQVTTLQKREKAAFEVKISYKDPESGRSITKTVDSRDTSLTTEQSKLAEKALAEKEEARVLKERDKVEAEWKATNERILDQRILEAAADARLTELTRVTDADMFDAISEESDPGKREALLKERKEQLMREHASEIKEIESISGYKIVDSYVERANTIFKQTPDLKYLLSLDTGESIKLETLSDADAAYLRSKWCVAVSTWNMLKGNFGDEIPDFIPFVKEMHEKGWIKNSNMELKATNNIVNYYAKEHGRAFDRVSLQSLGSREERYNQLANDLIKNKPEAITLRVKEDANEHGHTISMFRLPNGTYKVVDTAQPSINGTIFDPANVKGSPLGRNDDNNPYYEKSPKGYDYVK